jgi:imidazolonepropionase-like amidohydrolase
MKKTKITLLFVIFFEIICFAQKHDDFTQKDNCLVLTNVTVIDGIHPYKQEGMSIIIQGNTIVEIDKSSSISIPETASVINLKGKFVIPGLIEGHVHIRNLPDTQFAYTLRCGITTIRCMGDDVSYLKLIIDAINNGEISGPDIYYSAVFAGERFIKGDIRAKMATPGNYTLGEAPWIRMIDENSDILSVVMDAKKCGATGIKLINYLPPDQVKYITNEAHRQQMKVWFHPHLTYSDSKVIAEAGVDLITHAPLILLPSKWDLKTDGSLTVELDSLNSMRADSIFNIIKENNIFLEPTFSVYFDMLNKISDDSSKNQLKKRYVGIVKKANKLGITIIAGTDVDLPQSPDEKPALFDEIKYLVKLVGMTPYEALSSATLFGAKAIGIEKTHGSIETNKIADIVVLEKDPIDNIENLKTTSIVIKNGKIINLINNK